MPTLQFKGKNIIWNHHLAVPFHTLDEVSDLHYNPGKANGNMIIEGDNLTGLKALVPIYGNQIKCIYIDPPYNTKKQTWTYNDNVNSPLIKDWIGKSVGYDDLTRHDKWLCMITPRLKLLRELLDDNGLIFISIDDHEYQNLKSLCDEIFGEQSYVTTLVWNTEGHTDNQYDVKVNHEYILVYIKNAIKDDTAIGYVVDPNTREESNLWKGYAENSITKNGPGNPPSKVLLKRGFPVKTKEDKILPKSDLAEEYYDIVNETGYITRKITKKYKAKYPIRLSAMEFKGGVLNNDCEVFTGWANLNKLKKFIENGYKPIEDNGGKFSFYLSANGVVYYHKSREQARNIVSVLRNMGTTEQMKYTLEELGIDFDYPKPIELIKYILKIGGDEYSIILDSFAGSGTTMHAVMKLNKEDGGNRQCIMVQMTEATEAEPDKNICKDVTRERVKRAIDKFGYESGFKYFRVGIPLDAETMLAGQLPTYKQFAKYVYYLCTGENLDKEDSINEEMYFVGEFGKQAIYLVYKQDYDTLTRLALNLSMAERIKKEQPGKKRIVYAPSCFLDEGYLTDNQIDYVGIPYNLFQRNKE